MNYRSSLEVLKFTDFADVLRQFCSVCCMWARCGSSQELWLSFSEAKEFPPGQDTRESFRRAVLEGFALAYFDYYGITEVDCLSMSVTKKIRTSNQNLVGMFSVIVPGLGILSFGGLNRFQEIPSKAAKLYSDKETIQLQEMVTGRFRHAGIVVANELFVFGGIGEQSQPERINKEVGSSAIEICKNLDSETSRIIQSDLFVSPYMMDHPMPPIPPMHHDGTRSKLTAIKACEKLNIKNRSMLQSEHWTPLPNMLSGRRDFTLCTHNNIIWICGYSWSRNCHVETFDPLTSSFASFPCSDSLKDKISVAMDGPVLIILSKKHITHINTNTHSVKKQKQTFAWEEEIWPGRADMNVVQVGTTLFSVERNNVFTFDLVTHQSAYWIKNSREV